MSPVIKQEFTEDQQLEEDGFVITEVRLADRIANMSAEARRQYFEKQPSIKEEEVGVTSSARPQQQRVLWNGGSTAQVAPTANSLARASNADNQALTFDSMDLDTPTHNNSTPPRTSITCILL